MMRLAADARQKLAHLGLLPRVVDPVGHEIAHALERLESATASAFRASGSGTPRFVRIGGVISPGFILLIVC